MTIVRSYVPDPEPTEHTQAPPSAEGSNLPADELVWAAARHSYLKGLSTPVVAERHGLNERTVRRRAASEGWAEMRHRFHAAERERRRIAGLAGAPPSEEEQFALNPELRDFVAAHSYEVGELLLHPGPDALARFAFRRAAEMAAEGRPVEAGSWMRLVTQAHRIERRQNELGQCFSPADRMRAHDAAELRAAFIGDAFDPPPGGAGEEAQDGEGG